MLSCPTVVLLLTDSPAGKLPDPDRDEGGLTSMDPASVTGSLPGDVMTSGMLSPLTSGAGMPRKLTVPLLAVLVLTILRDAL